MGFDGGLNDELELSVSTAASKRVCGTTGSSPKSCGRLRD